MLGNMMFAMVPVSSFKTVFLLGQVQEVVSAGYLSRDIEIIVK
jgi:hypothetical protein